MMKRLILAAVAAAALTAPAMAQQTYKFAIVPKAMNNPYFDLSRDGWMKRAKELGNVECIYKGPVEHEPASQAQIIQDLISQKVDGIAISCLNGDLLTDEVIGRMARFKEIKVVAGTSPARLDEPAAVSALPRYGLEGRVRLDQDRFRLSARLVNQRDGAVIWTRTYDAQIGARELLDIETDIASDIAVSLAQPYGVIFQADASALADAPTKDAKAYACALSYYGYHT